MRIKFQTLPHATACEKVEVPCDLIRRDKILKAVRMMKKGKSAVYWILMMKLKLWMLLVFGIICLLCLRCLNWYFVLTLSGRRGARTWLGFLRIF